MSQINFVTICLPQRLLLCLLGFNYIFTIILRVKKTQWCRYVVQGLSGLLFTTPGPGFKVEILEHLKRQLLLRLKRAFD